MSTQHPLSPRRTGTHPAVGRARTRRTWTARRIVCGGSCCCCCVVVVVVFVVVVAVIVPVIIVAHPLCVCVCVLCARARVRVLAFAHCIVSMRLHVSMCCACVRSLYCVSSHHAGDVCLLAVGYLEEPSESTRRLSASNHRESRRRRRRTPDSTEQDDRKCTRWRVHVLGVRGPQNFRAKPCAAIRGYCNRCPSPRSLSQPQDKAMELQPLEDSLSEVEPCWLVIVRIVPVLDEACVVDPAYIVAREPRKA